MDSQWVNFKIWKQYQNVPIVVITGKVIMLKSVEKSPDLRTHRQKQTTANKSVKICSIRKIRVPFL